MISKNIEEGNLEEFKKIQVMEDNLINNFPIKSYKEILKNSTTPEHDACDKEWEYQTEKLFEIIENQD